MTRTIQASDIGAFHSRSAAEHVIEVPATNGAEQLDNEEPEFIQIPLSVTPDPKVYQVFSRILTQHFSTVLISIHLS